MTAAMASSSALVLLTAALLLLAPPRPSSAYRIRGSAEENKTFVPYERGFVQDAAGGGRTARPSPASIASPVLRPEDGRGGRVVPCPGMVGPDAGGRRYCGGPERGVCDARTGTCHCAPGASGPDCSGCDPLHLRDGEGGPCVPRLPCPGGCSGAGECDELTGRCDCAAHRTGEGCAEARCTNYHRFCVRCDGDGCLECEEGFGVVPAAGGGGQCWPCWKLDPRCRSCGVDVDGGGERMACTSCVDLLLLSIHRSGRRPQDPPLPPDELARELSVAVPFGSVSAGAFVDAEHYFLVDEGLWPLNGSAVECHQGLDMVSFPQSVMVTHSCLPALTYASLLTGEKGRVVDLRAVRSRFPRHVRQPRHNNLRLARVCRSRRLGTRPPYRAADGRGRG